MDTSVEEELDLLAKFTPEIAVAYRALASAAASPVAGGLSPKERELVMLAYELGAHKLNPVPTHHASRALEEGASPAELAQVAAIALWLGGIVGFRENARFLLPLLTDSDTTGDSLREHQA